MLKEILDILRNQWAPTLVEVFDEKIALCSGAYDAGDVVAEATSGSTPWLFKNIAKVKGGGGYITSALITAETTAIASVFSLFLFRDIPTCALNDDVANTAPILADRFFYAGRIDFTACTSIGTGMSEAVATPSTYGNIPKAFVCALGSRDLYGVLVIQNALDLADSTKLNIKLIVEQY